MLKTVVVFLISIFSVSSFAFAGEGSDKSTKEKDQNGCTSCGSNSQAAQNQGLYNTAQSTGGNKPVYDANGLDTAESREAAAKDSSSNGINAVGAKGDQTQPKNLNSSTEKDNLLGIEEGKLRKGDVDMNTIPLVIVNIISVLLGVAGTVAVFSLIYHAVQMQINSGITGDSSGVDKAKKGMIGSLIGFVIAISAWFLVTRAVDLLSTIS